MVLHRAAHVFVSALTIVEMRVWRSCCRCLFDRAVRGVVFDGKEVERTKLEIVLCGCRVKCDPLACHIMNLFTPKEARPV